jgi:LPXTG-site transpeptidase (sortase) family protein
MDAGAAEGAAALITRLALLLALSGLAAAACAPPPASGEPAGRTALPTWTLPFSVPSDTPAPATRAAVQPASATPGSAAEALPTQPAAAPTTAPTQPVPQPTPASPPRQLIPDQEKDVEIRQVGILSGTWDLEHLGGEVGRLYTTGSHPGDDLAMVLVGHVTTAPGRYGPFAGIGQLAIDSQVVYRWAGQDYVYAVRSMELTGANDVQRLYVPDGGQLLLVTCDNWNFLSGQYQRRLIVTAEWIGTLASQ